MKIFDFFKQKKEECCNEEMRALSEKVKELAEALAKKPTDCCKVEDAPAPKDNCDCKFPEDITPEQ